MSFFRKRYAPSLLNLAEYERGLIVSMYMGGHLMPPPCIPVLRFGGTWSEQEISAMEQNRILAKALYEKYQREAREFKKFRMQLDNVL